MRSDKRGEVAITSVVAVVLVLAFLVFGLFFTGIIKTEFANLDRISQNGCWTTNSLRCGGGAFVTWPSLCLIDDRTEVDEKELAIMLRDTWWMFKQGECDFGSVGDEIYQTYIFTPKENIVIADFLNTLKDTKRGRVVTDVTKSDYNYLETGTTSNTLCFDTGDKEGIANGVLAAGETYYIIYYDDQGILGSEFNFDADAILISRNPGFDKGYYQEILKDLGHTLLTIGTVSDSSFTKLNTLVPGTILVLLNTEEEGCLVYGPV